MFIEIPKRPLTAISIVVYQQNHLSPYRTKAYGNRLFEWVTQRQERVDYVLDQ